MSAHRRLLDGLRAHAGLVGVLALAALLRLVTLGRQSLWFDEAFTPTHVLHSGLGATLRAVAHTENTPPLYYIVDWAWTRVLGTGEVALRSLSAVAGLALVGVAWWVGRELHSRRCGLILALLVAVNPLYLWYSQEARAYALFALLGAVSLGFFLRARRLDSGGSLAAWAIVCILALATHYFAAFLIIGEAAWLLAAGPRRRTLIAVAAVGAAGLALLPMVLDQGGHGAQWIGRWSLGSRLVAIPQYLELGPSAAPLGHALLAAACLPVLVGVALLARSGPFQPRGPVMLMASVGGAGILIPLALAVVGQDYLAPRNLIAALFALTAALAVVLAADPPWRGVPLSGGMAVTAVITVIGLGMAAAVTLRPRLQRGDWRGVAALLGPVSQPRAVVTVALGSAPLEYYRPPLRVLGPRQSIAASEVDLVGYRPLVGGATRPPGPEFRLTSRHEVHGLVVLRFNAGRPVALGQARLLARRITRVRSQVLVAG